MIVAVLNVDCRRAPLVRRVQAPTDQLVLNLADIRSDRRPEACLGTAFSGLAMLTGGRRLV